MRGFTPVQLQESDNQNTRLMHTANPGSWCNFEADKPTGKDPLQFERQRKELRAQHHERLEA